MDWVVHMLLMNHFVTLGMPWMTGIHLRLCFFEHDGLELINELSLAFVACIPPEVCQLSHAHVLCAHISFLSEKHLDIIGLDIAQVRIVIVVVAIQTGYQWGRFALTEPIGFLLQRRWSMWESYGSFLVWTSPVIQSTSHLKSWSRTGMNSKRPDYSWLRTSPWRNYQHLRLIPLTLLRCLGR